MKKLYLRGVRLSELQNNRLQQFHADIKKRYGEISLADMIRSLWTLTTSDPECLECLREMLEHYLTTGTIERPCHEGCKRK